MSEDIKQTSNFKSTKIWIMFLFYVLSFFKKGDTIQGGPLFKGGHYLRKYGSLKWLNQTAPCTLRIIFVVVFASMFMYFKICQGK